MDSFVRYLTKNKISMAIIAVLTLSFFVCVFMAVKPKKEYFFHLPETVLTEENGGEVILESGISLTPGTWSFNVEYSSDIDFGSSFIIKDSSVSDKLLWFNGVVSYSGLTNVSFTVYSFAFTDNVDFCVRHTKGITEPYNLTVKETPLFWTRMAVITAMLFGAVIYFFFILFRIKNRLLSKESKIAVILVNLIWIVASVPLIHRGVFFGADLGFHVLRIDGTKEAIVNGIFPVRIEPQWQQGFGFADAIFYCPYFLYIPALFELAGFYISEVVIIYYILLNIVTAWISYYCFSAVLKNKTAGIIASAVYVFSIYRINTIYHVGMVGVGTAVVFIPLIFLSVWRLIFENREDGKYTFRDWLPLAIGFTGIVQCHVLSSEIAFFVMLGTCILHIVPIIRRKAIVPVLKAAATAVGLCFWFLVPFIDYYLTQDIVMKHAGARQIQSEGFYLSQHLLLFTKSIDFPGTQHSHPLGIGFFAVLILFLLSVMWYTGRIEKNTKNDMFKFVKYSLVSSLVLLLFTLNIFPWDNLQKFSSVLEPLIGNIEYPHRFQAWIFAYVAFLAGFIYVYFSEQGRIVGERAVSVCVLLSVIFSFGWLVFAVDGTGRLALYNVEAMGNGYTAGDGYNYYGTKPEGYVYGTYNAGDGAVIRDTQKGALRAEVLCENTGDEESWIEFPLINYKEYIAESDVGHLRVESGNNFVVRVIIPPHFSGKVKVRFVRQWYWTVAEIISAIMYWLLMGYGVYSRISSKRRDGNVG